MDGLGHLFRKKVHPNLQPTTSGPMLPNMRCPYHTDPLVQPISSNPYNASLLDMGELSHIRSQQAYRAGEKPVEVVYQSPTRPWPWIMDIFLYPMNLPGLTLFAVSVLIPAVFTTVAVTLWMGDLLRLLTSILLTIGGIGIVGVIVLQLYLFWYVGECIIDSAQGGLRVPDTAGHAPSLTDIVRRALQGLTCMALFVVPLALLLYKKDINRPLLLVLTTGMGYLLPMGLLAVVMFGSLRALNPVLIISSIGKTFWPYTLLTGTLTGIAGCAYLFMQSPLFHIIVRTLNRYLWPVMYMAGCYLLLVLGHILGRFYFRYHEKLKWLD